MARILWIGDAVATTGFSRVNHSIIKNLDLDYYDIHHLGINYRGDPHGYDHLIYPALNGGDPMGFGRMIPLIRELKPDFLFILNDPWVVHTYLSLLVENEIKIPVVVYFPVDALGLSRGWFEHYDLVKKLCVYTEFAKEEVLKIGAIHPDGIEVIPHGADPEKFYPLDNYYNSKGELIKTGNQIARESLYPTEQAPSMLTDFIILNANRNQPRKRIDITLNAFREFQKGKDDVKLYLHMGNIDAGWHLDYLSDKWGFNDKLILSTAQPQMPNIPDERLNTVYNATDIGINTSMGEGWGLTNWEQAMVGKPQIVPDHSACSELWSENGLLIPILEGSYIYRSTSTEAKVPSTKELVNLLEWAYLDWQNGGEELKRLGDAGREMTLRPEYQWENIAKKFDNIFRQIVEN